jgi:hypothetical protein
VKRREFIGLLGGAAAWPLAVLAQQPEPMRRVGVLITTAVNDPDGQSRLASFLKELESLGWADGRNIQFRILWLQVTRKTSANMLQNWSRSHRMSSWRREARRSNRSSRQLATSQAVGAHPRGRADRMTGASE